jgi:hypothetical protein
MVGRQIGVREDLLVTPTFASWNQIAHWLRQLDNLRSAA